MLENIPSQSTMMELLGQPLFEVWQLKECDIEYVHPIIEHSWGRESFASMIRTSILSKSERI